MIIAVRGNGMSDLISRQAAIDALVGITMFETKHEIMQRVNASVQDEQGWLGAVAECLDEIEDLPSAQPERIKGKWIELDISDATVDEWQSMKCSVCGRYHTTPYVYYPKRYAYCPHCGAEMEQANE